MAPPPGVILKWILCPMSDLIWPLGTCIPPYATQPSGSVESDYVKLRYSAKYSFWGILSALGARLARTFRRSKLNYPNSSAHTPHLL